MDCNVKQVKWIWVESFSTLCNVQSIDDMIGLVSWCWLIEMMQFVLLVLITCLILENLAIGVCKIAIDGVYAMVMMHDVEHDVSMILMQAKQINLRSGLCRVWGMYMLQGQCFNGSTTYLHYGFAMQLGHVVYFWLHWWWFCIISLQQVHCVLFWIIVLWNFNSCWWTHGLKNMVPLWLGKFKWHGHGFHLWYAIT